jgi:hypothetical protein
MTKRYGFLNMCLKVLSYSNLPTTMKLRIELLLLQTKMSLLKLESNSTLKSNYPCEGEFAALYDHVKIVCNSNSTGAEIAKLIHHVQTIKNSFTNLAVSSDMDTLNKTDVPFLTQFNQNQYSVRSPKTQS